LSAQVAFLHEVLARRAYSLLDFLERAAASGGTLGDISNAPNRSVVLRGAFGMARAEQPCGFATE